MRQTVLPLAQWLYHCLQLAIWVGLVFGLAEYSFGRCSRHKFHSREIRFLQSITFEQVLGILQIWQRAYLLGRQKRQTQCLYTLSLHQILTFL